MHGLRSRRRVVGVREERPGITLDQAENRRDWTIWLGVGGFALVLVVGLSIVFLERGTFPAHAVRIVGEPGLPSTAQPATRPVVRVLVASMVSPDSTYESYARFVGWLAEQIHYPVKLVQRRNYFEANEALRRGEVDMAFICSGAFVASEREGHGSVVIAVPVVGGETTYHAAVIVREASPIQTLADLRGKSMAFVDPLSLTGRQYIRHRLAGMALVETQFFSRTMYTGSHDRSVEAVVLGLVDAASVDELVLNEMRRSRPELRLRVIERSPSFGIPPVVVPAGTPDGVRRMLADALLTMHQNEAGREILNAMHLERFERPDPALYDSVRALGPF